jgi:hypothetical protein
VPAKRALTEPRRPKTPTRFGCILRGGSITRELQFSLAEFSGGRAPALSSHSAVYVLEKTGYVKVRESENGFTAIFQHSTPEMNEPQCMDAEGSRTILQRYLKAAEWRAQGKTPQEIRQPTAAALAKGELKASSHPGVDYMLSSINTVQDAKGRVAHFPPHVMFFGTNLTNADLGVGKERGPDGQPTAPIFVAADGSPYSLVIVPFGKHGEMRIL